MPIYEYLCPACNRIYSFLAKSADEKKKPTCPKCKSKDLRKMLSRFSLGATTRKSASDAPADGAKGDAPDGAPDKSLDPRAERELMRLMESAEGMDENDPKQMGRLMRRMSEISGEKLDGEMADVVRRLEAGEDPEKIEDEMGDVLNDEAGAEGNGWGAPSHDDGLYPM